MGNVRVRLFVLITSMEPLTVYVYKDFYLRVAVAKYSEDLNRTKQDDTVHQITGTCLNAMGFQCIKQRTVLVPSQFPSIDSRTLPPFGDCRRRARCDDARKVAAR